MQNKRLLVRGQVVIISVGKYCPFSKKSMMYMAPLRKIDIIPMNKIPCSYEEQDAIDALYFELKKGIDSMKKGEVYTIDEAWEKIDRI